MRQEDFDRLLSSEELIVPSSGFADAVMQAVRREATAAQPISFPWKCALPGLGLAGLLVVVMLLAPVPAARAGVALLGSTHLRVLFAAVPETTRRLGLDWLMMALLLAWASVKLSTGLASWKS
jgi:hypothetical protein